MSVSKEERISKIKIDIDRYNNSKNIIKQMRQEMEEKFYTTIKRYESYINSESISDAGRMMYSDKIHEAQKAYIELDEEHEENLRQIDKKIEENEEMIRNLEKQDEEENEDDNSEKE